VSDPLAHFAPLATAPPGAPPFPISPAPRAPADGEPVRTPDDVAVILRLHAVGWGAKYLAAEVGCARNAVKRHLATGRWAPKSIELNEQSRPENLLSADGSKLAYTRARGIEVWSAATGTVSSAITHQKAGKLYWLEDPSWSSDSKMLVAQTSKAGLVKALPYAVSYRSSTIPDPSCVLSVRRSVVRTPSGNSRIPRPRIVG